MKLIRHLVIRIVAALVIGGLLIVIPVPDLDTVVALRAAVVSFAVVVYLGKTIYDTLFYPRYRP